MDDSSPSIQVLLMDNLTFGSSKLEDPVPTSVLLHFHITMSGVWYVICLTGVCTNLLNLRTFSIIGLKDSVTVAFFCLAISDFCICSAAFVEMLAFTFDVLMRRYDLYFYLPPIIPDFFMMTVRKIFNTTTILITTFLAIQRCLCVVLPFHVKGMFTRSRTLVFMAAILTLSLTFSALYMSRHKVVPTFNEAFNRSQLQVVVPPGSEPYLFLMEVFVGTAVNFTCQLVVMTCLLVMGLALRRSSEFRQSAASSAHVTNTETASAKAIKGPAAVQNKEKSKNNQALIQVSLVSIIFVITNSPYLASGITNVLIPEYGIYEDYHNLYNLVNNFIFTMDLLNSSVNFFVYYRYNTKFRKSCPFGKRNGNDKNNNS